MLRKIRSRLKCRRGFTLAELLITVIILLLVTAIVAGGIPVAVNAYTKIVDTSNAQLLLSTTLTRLREELGTATNVSVGDDNISVAYTSEFGSASMIYLASGEKKGIYIREYIGLSSDPQFDHLLVSNAASNENLYVTYDNPVTYANGVVTFTNIEVTTGEKVLASADSFSVRVLSDVTP